MDDIKPCMFSITIRKNAPELALLRLSLREGNKSVDYQMEVSSEELWHHPKEVMKEFKRKIQIEPVFGR